MNLARLFAAVALGVVLCLASCNTASTPEIVTPTPSHVEFADGLVAALSTVGALNYEQSAAIEAGLSIATAIGLPKSDAADLVTTARAAITAAEKAQAIDAPTASQLRRGLSVAQIIAAARKK